MRLFLLLSISSIVSAANGPFQFGESRARAVDFNSSSKVQTAEYTDGFKFSVTTLTAITMNVVTQEAVNPGTLGANLEPLNDYAYIVKTSNADVKLAAELRIPCELYQLNIKLQNPNSSSQPNPLRPHEASRRLSDDHVSDR